MIARRCELPRGSYWGLTWRELYREVALWAERVRTQHNRDMTLAWQVANLTNAKRLPPLARILSRRPQAKAQTFDEQKSILMQLAQTYGGSVRPMPLNG